MNVSPLTGVLGAEVHDIALGDDLSDSDIAAIRAALVEHQVLVFRNQNLTPAQQSTYSKRFGPVGDDPFVNGMADQPDVVLVLKEVDEGHAFNFGGSWHADWTFMPTPPAFTVLHAIDIPPHGGDTIWSSMTAAWKYAPETKREQLLATTAIHTARDAYGPQLREMYDQLAHMDIITSESAGETHEHPLITQHPESGEQVLWFNSGYVKDLRGPGLDTPDDVQALMLWLHQHTISHQFTFRHRWQTGDLLMWDNRSTQHLALNDYAGFRRQLHRTTVGGTAPVAASA